MLETTEKRRQSFLVKLKAYIDTYYLASNHQLCKEYALDEAYFAPSIVYGKQEIINVITQEAKQRAKDKTRIIKDYRMLSARMATLSLKLAFDIAKLEQQNRSLQKMLISKGLLNKLFFKKHPKLYEKLVHMYQRLQKDYFSK